MNQRQYKQAVSELRNLLASNTGNQWQMGDLLLAVVPMYAPDAGDVLKRLEADLGGEIRASTMNNLRRTSYAWPARERKRASWSAHFHLKHNRDLLKNGMTTPEAIRLVSKKERNRFGYAVRLLKSSITFMQAAERYLPEIAADEERMTVMGPLLHDAEVALGSMLEAAGMTDEQHRPARAA